MKKLREILNKIFGRGRNRNNTPPVQNDGASQPSTTDEVNAHDEGIDNGLDLLEMPENLRQKYTNRQNREMYISTRTDATRDSILMPAAMPINPDARTSKDTTDEEIQNDMRAVVDIVQKGGDEASKLKKGINKEKNKNVFARNKKKLNGLQKELKKLETAGTDKEMKDLVAKRDNANKRLAENNPEMKERIDFSENTRRILDPMVDVKAKTKDTTESTKRQLFKGRFPKAPEQPANDQLNRPASIDLSILTSAGYKKKKAAQATTTTTRPDTPRPTEKRPRTNSSDTQTTASSKKSKSKKKGSKHRF